MKQTILKNSLILILLVLAGCAIKRYQPAPGDYLIEDNYAIVRTDSLVIAIRPQVYRSPHGNLGDPYFSLYAKVQNVSAREIAIERKDLQLLIQSRQFSPIPLDWLLLSSPAPAYWDWDDPMFPLQDQTNNRQQYETDRYDLIANAFSFDSILPGARKEGFLFYSLDSVSTDSLEVDVFGNRVNFVRH